MFSMDTQRYQIREQNNEVNDEESASHDSVWENLTQRINRLIQLKLPIFIVEDRQFQMSQQFSRQQKLKQKILSYNRKDKSLEELSKKFIQNFEGKQDFVLELDKVTVHFNVERRRIYDIVNIFESLQVVRKVAKNNYVWRGLKMAIQAINQIMQKGGHYSPKFKRQKSLQNLAQRFLNLFIFSSQPIYLDQAARILMDTQDIVIIKTKIRRLYDIVNVFKSVGLVRKIRLSNNKSGYEWMGVKQLQNIILEKRREKQQKKVSIIIDQKENNQILVNKNNIDEEVAQKQNSLLELALFQRYVFEPEILKGEVAPFTFESDIQ